MTVTFRDTAELATDKQTSFIISLMTERNLDLDEMGDLIGVMTKAQASARISELLAQPKARKATVKAELASGIYRVNGDVFKVYAATGSGRMLAKKLVRLSDGSEWAFEYAGLASRFILSAKPLTLAEAKEFGAIYGVCCNCGRTLTDETSIAEGIGPICASRF